MGHVATCKPGGVFRGDGCSGGGDGCKCVKSPSPREGVDMICQH